MAKKAAGFVVYDGPSQLDGTPIVAILMTGHSSNRATGDMAQLYILDRDLAPTEAVRTGQDASVCGQCPLRNTPENRADGKGGCYVVPLLVNVVWRAWKSGNYATQFTDIDVKRAVAGRLIRLGSYGDPTALPISVVQRVLTFGAGHTGYTHQWRTVSPQWRRILMASCETIPDVVQAHRRGWRTFRSRLAGTRVHASEIRCPKDDVVIPEHKRRQCGSCKACDGWKRPGQRSVVITAHGGISSIGAVKRALTVLTQV